MSVRFHDQTLPSTSKSFFETKMAMAEMPTLKKGGTFYTVCGYSSKSIELTLVVSILELVYVTDFSKYGHK